MTFFLVLQLLQTISFTKALKALLCFYEAENQVVSRLISLAMNELAWLHISTFG